MDTSCQRMDMLNGKLEETIESLKVLHPYVQSQQLEAAHQPASEPRGRMISLGVNHKPDIILENQEAEYDGAKDDANEEFYDENDEDEEGAVNLLGLAAKAKPDHIMTTDSYGKLR